MQARRAPAALLVPAFIGIAFLGLPLVGVLFRTPWPLIGQKLSSPDVVSALVLSLISASLATLVSLVLGVPLAWVLARSSLPGRGALRTLVTVPLVLPPVVGGVALFAAFGRTGILGKLVYNWFGYTVTFSSTAVVMAETFVAMPFLIIAVDGALRSGDGRFEEAAATLGASRWMTFRTVTLPMMTPAMVSGAVLCWARALGEFGATVTFAGSYPGRTETMPILVNILLQNDPDGALVLAMLLLVVAIVILFLLRNRWVNAVV